MSTSQLVDQNTCSFSRRKLNRDAGGPESESQLRRQHSDFALFCRFMGILRLFKDSDLIVEYDDGERRNFFDFREPKSALGQRCPSISGGAEDLPPADASPGTTGERYERILVIVSQETTRAEFMGVRPVLRWGKYYSIVVDKVSHQRTVMVYGIDHGCHHRPFGNRERFP